VIGVGVRAAPPVAAAVDARGADTAAADADALDAGVPLTVSRRDPASIIQSRGSLAGVDGVWAGVAAVAAVADGVRAVTAWEDDTAAGRDVLRPAESRVTVRAFGVPVWEPFALWAAPVVAVESPVSAHAAPIPEPTATPIPSATANPPTRPMHVDAVTPSSIRDSWPPHGHFHPT
jgi:hypothetical protein